MKKRLFLISLTFMMIYATFQPTVVHATPFDNLDNLNAVRLSQEMIDLLPAGYLIPAKLPSTIREQILLAGWVYLYNQNESLLTWNGDALTGQLLAKYVLDQKVAIQWNTTNECNGKSCTIPPSCKKSFLASLQVSKNKNPILITTAYQDIAKLSIAVLAGTLAHEIYHHTLPFGCGPDTLFEEYWAFSIASKISKRNPSSTDSYNSMVSACLSLWITSNGLEKYLVFNPYPPSVAPLVDTSTTECVVI